MSHSPAAGRKISDAYKADLRKRGLRHPREPSRASSMISLLANQMTKAQVRANEPIINSSHLMALMIPFPGGRGKFTDIYID